MHYSISECFIAMSPYHRTAAAPKTKIILPGDEAAQAIQSDSEIVQNTVGPVRTVQHGDSK